MTETVEQLCQRIMEARGYLVISGQKQHLPGEVIQRIANHLPTVGPLDHPTVVIAETNEADYRAQSVVAGRLYRPPAYGALFYRVIAE